MSAVFQSLRCVHKIAITSKIVGIVEAVITELQSRKALSAMLASGSIVFSTELETDSTILLTEPSIGANCLNDERSSSLIWVQSTFAGVNHLIDRTERRNYFLTRIGSGFGPQMVEYCFGWLLYLSQQISQCCHEQRSCSWRPGLYQSRQMLWGKTIGILGTGDIGTHISNASVAFNMNPIGFQKSFRTCLAPFYRVSNNIEDILRDSDIIVNCLPSTFETRGLLTLEMFELCKYKRPVFINVGRGDITSCEVIEEAIMNNYISDAILDVVEREPLDPSHSIWTNPRVHITPHISAISTPHLVAKIFCNNLEHFVEGRQLEYLVDLSKGY